MEIKNNRGATLSEPSLEILNDRLQALHRDVSDVKAALTSLTDAITKLALIEERQSATNTALGRAFTAVEKLEDRIAILEREYPLSKRNGVWIERFIIAVVTGAAALIWERFKS